MKTGASAEMKISGEKRPIRERLGANVENPSFPGGQSKNKRLLHLFSELLYLNYHGLL